MALRYSCKGCTITQAGVTFTHNLIGYINPGALPGPNYQAPDEWKVNHRAPSPGAAAFYLVSAPTSTTITWAASGASGSADMFCAINASQVL